MGFLYKTIVLFACAQALASPTLAINQEIPLKLADGRELVATLRVPPGATGKLPAILVFGGFQNAARVLDLVHPPEPAILASFDYPFTPPRRFAFPESLRHAPEVKRMIADTIEGIELLASTLATRVDVDTAKITIIGASLGAPFAVIGASRSSAITGVVAIHGFGKIPDTAMHQMLRSWTPRYGALAYPAAWLISRIGWAYLGAPNPEDAIARLGDRHKFFMISAQEDTFVPSSASEALWLAAEHSKSSKQRIIMPGDHLLPGSEALIEQILTMVTKWMNREGLLGS